MQALNQNLKKFAGDFVIFQLDIIWLAMIESSTSKVLPQKFQPPTHLLYPRSGH